MPPAGAIEAGDPRADLAAYRRCLGQFATGVSVVTTRAGDAVAGVTANSFSSVSLAPPLVSWSIKHASQSFGAFEAATHFAVSVLGSDQIALSQHFGRSAPDKFAGIAWRPGLGGAPLVAGALASFECRVAARHPAGDHTIMLGEVERFSRSSGEALLFVQGRYGLAADHPDMSPALPSPPDTGPTGPTNDFLTSLLYRAHGVLSAGLERGRRAEGFTLLEGRILAAIATFPGITADELAERLFLGANSAGATVARLGGTGLLAPERPALRMTPLGEARLATLLERTRRIEDEALSGIPAQDLATVRRVLARIVDGAA